MTSSQQPVPPVIPPIFGTDETDEPDTERDSDATPVGRDDLRADVERSGGDPDSI
jgi:hypothetical protein